MKKWYMTKLTVALWLTCLAASIVTCFWLTELRYQLPTPIPQNYKAIALGSDISLPSVKKDKPVFLHFFNPDCPCSRFNISHFKTLVQEYSDKVDFMIVPITEKHWSEKKIQEKFGLPIPVLEDSRIAEVCGVYSTPQAVIIDKHQKLYYRGNYNRSRYCTDKKTAYAKNALQALINNQSTAFDTYALKAYGCQLPTCSK